MTLTYDFDGDEFEYEADIDTSEYADVLYAGYFRKCGAKEGVRKMLEDLCVIGGDPEYDGDFQDYLEKRYGDGEVHGADDYADFIYVTYFEGADTHKALVEMCECSDEIPELLEADDSFIGEMKDRYEYEARSEYEDR